MVTSHARKFVPGSKLSACDQAFTSVSWTRSSATLYEPESEMAKARKIGNLRHHLLSECGFSHFFSRCLASSLGEQHDKFVGDRLVNEVVAE